MSTLWTAAIRSDDRGRRSRKLLATLPDRLKTLQRWVSYELAKRLQQEVVAAIPAGKAHSRYRRSITTRRVLVPGGRIAYSVYVDPEAHGVTEVDPATVVVYIRARRRRLVRPSPQVRVLEKHNPWTFEALPFLPSAREAVIVSRKVSPQEVAAVTSARLKDAPVWKADLGRVGSRIRRRDRVPLPKQAGHPVPDVVFEGLRLEKGLAGVKASPHWRPGLEATVRWARRLALQRRTVMVKLLSDPARAGHSLVPRLKGLRTSEALKFQAFQKLVGVHSR